VGDDEGAAGAGFEGAVCEPEVFEREASVAVPFWEVRLRVPFCECEGVRGAMSSDRVLWARKRTRRVTLFDPDEIDVGALTAIGNKPGLLIAAPKGSIDSVTIELQNRPERFVSHTPRVKR
jgi:hypothetical protein